MLFFEKKYFIAIVFIFIFCFGAFVRLYQLNENPGWYVDEGSNLELGWNLIHGQTRYFAVEWNFIPHLPFYYLLIGFFSLIFGKTILAVRLLSVVCSLATLIIIYFLGKEIHSKKAGILSAAFFVFSPWIVIDNRMGLVANFLMCGVMLFLYFIICYYKKKKTYFLYIASLTLGLVLLSELYMIALIFVFLIFFWHDKKIWRSVFISLLPLIIFLLIMIAVRESSFLMDIRYYFFDRLYEGGSFGSSLVNILGFILERFINNIWIPLGIVGLFFIKPRKIRWLAIVILIFSGLLLVLSGSRSLFYRSEQIFYPLIIIGFFVVLFWLNDIFFLKRKLIGNLIIFIIISYIFVSNIFSVNKFFHNAFLTERYNSSFVKSISDVEKIADYLNNRIDDDTFIICPDHICQLINTEKKANFAEVGAAEGYNTDIFSTHNLTQDRFYFDAHVNKAKYIIYDEKYTDWLKYYMKIEQIIEQIQNWPADFQVSEFTIYRNPDLK